MRPVLVLRPEPGAAATAARARAIGLDAIVAPLFAIRPVAWDPPTERPQALMLTSANAARHADLSRYRALPAYAVGEATAAAARAAGLRDVRVGGADAEALLAIMAADGIDHALHLAGREHRDVAHPAVRLTRRIAYAAEPVDTLPPPAADALGAGAIALLHSPRAATLFAALTPSRGRIAALSPAVAAAAGPGWQAVAVAESPDDASLLAAAARLCD